MKEIIGSRVYELVGNEFSKKMNTEKAFIVVKVKGYDAIKKKEVTIRASDYLAIVFQHELDHFKGILYYDHINSADPFKEEKGEIVIE